ncbi:uncharacterized protein LOC143289415 [Babylonia areolata]|uniref:uncharacterized protein LOC143289415 n=1 Tax=Babylonia areolata TaxID=304850 RepID=UPI003FD5F71B
MDRNSMLRYHALYQRSWTGKPRDAARKSSRDVTSSLCSQSDSGSFGSKKTGFSRLSKRNPSQDRSQSSSPCRSQNDSWATTPRREASQTSRLPVRVTMDPLSSRRTQRLGRRRPWSEKAPELSSRSDEFELVYEALIPNKEWAEYRSRQFVTNPRYGQLYEVRREKPRPPRREKPQYHWLWENEFRLWCLEKTTPRKDTPAGLPSSGAVSEVNRNHVIRGRPPRPLPASHHRPHADLFAAYHSQTLSTQRRGLAATVVQRHVRGWLVRKHLRQMARQALLGLGRAWPGVTWDYRQLLTRLQVRHSLAAATSGRASKVSCPFSLVDMQDYLDRREKYERAFEKVAPDNQLSRDQLMAFLRECGHFPTDGELNTALSTVFKGVKQEGQRSGTGFSPLSLASTSASDLGLAATTTQEGSRSGSRSRSRSRSAASTPGTSDTTTTTTTTTYDDGGNNSAVGVERGESVTTPTPTTNDHDDDDDDVRGDDDSCGRAEGSGRRVRGTGRGPPCAEEGGVQTEACRPLTKAQAVEVVWTLHPPPASGLNAPRSRWIRPLVGGDPAWALLDEDVIKATDFKVCLGLVVKSRLEREGVVTLPSDVRAGVEEVTTYEEAMQKIEDYLSNKKREQD